MLHIHRAAPVTRIFPISHQPTGGHTRRHTSAAKRPHCWRCCWSGSAGSSRCCSHCAATLSWDPGRHTGGGASAVHGWAVAAPVWRSPTVWHITCARTSLDTTPGALGACTSSTDQPASPSGCCSASKSAAMALNTMRTRSCRELAPGARGRLLRRHPSWQQHRVAGRRTMLPALRHAVASI